MSAPLPPSIRPVQVRIFVAKDGRGHIILNKDAVEFLKARNLITQGYLYLDFSGTAMVLKQTRSAEIPNIPADALGGNDTATSATDVIGSDTSEAEKLPANSEKENIGAKQ